MLQRDESGKLPAFAWPGGYPIYYLADDGEALCPDCANLPEAHEGGDGDGWRLEGQGVHWEGEPLSCAHCNREIESAYGVPS